jgi:hypothetical protein
VYNSQGYCLVALDRLRLLSWLARVLVLVLGWLRNCYQIS